jgi:anti-sigma factor RsiW
MNEKSCLSNQDLVLHYYEELAADCAQLRHLAGCPRCAERFAALGRDLAQLPSLAYEEDHAAGTRMAARLNEQLQSRRSRRWLPAMGAAAVATLALVATLAVWSPRSTPVQTVHVTTPPQAILNPDDDLPDIDFLEEMDLLQDLDLLSQIEGV